MALYITIDHSQQKPNQIKFFEDSTSSTFIINLNIFPWVQLIQDIPNGIITLRNPSITYKIIAADVAQIDTTMYTNPSVATVYAALIVLFKERVILSEEEIIALISAGTAGVSSFNGRTGAVTLTNTDVNTALGYVPFPTPNGTVLEYITGTGSLAIFPTKLSDFTNDPGFITASSTNNLTNKSGLISQWTNDVGYLTSATFPGWQQGGNSFGTLGILGTLDGYELSLVSNSTPSLMLDGVTKTATFWSSEVANSTNSSLKVNGKAIIGSAVDNGYRLQVNGAMTLAPITLPTIPVNYALETDGTHLYFTLGGIRLQLDDQGAGALTIGTIDSVPKSADGLVLASDVLYMQSADATYPGLVNTTTQTWAGNKTLQGQFITIADLDLVYRRATNSNALYGLSLQTSAGQERAFFKMNQSSGEIRIGAGGNSYFPTFYSNGVEIFRILTTGEISIGSTLAPSKVTLTASGLGAYQATSAQSVAGLMLTTATAATSTVQQNGAPFILRSNAWNTTASASQPVDWRFVNFAIAGATPSSSLRLQFGVNNANLAEPFLFSSIGQFNAVGNIVTNGSFILNLKMIITSPSDGIIALRNFSGVDFGMLHFGDGTSAFPALKRVENSLHVRLADDSGDAPLHTGELYPVNNIWSNIRTITASTTIDKTYSTILVDASAGNVVVTLPSAASSFSTNFGISFTIVRIDSSVNTVIIAAASGDTIDGLASVTIPEQYASVTVQSSGGTTWYQTTSVATASVLTVGTLDSVAKSANGVSIIAGVLYMQSADATYPGLVNTGAQTFAGAKTFTGNVNVNANVVISSANFLMWTLRSRMYSSADGVITMVNNAVNGFDRLTFGGTTSAFPALKRSGVNLIVRLADDSGNSDLEVASEAYGPTWSGSAEVPTKGDLYLKLESGVFGFTDGNGFDGTITGSNLSLTTQLIEGSVPFIGAGGALLEDNANFFWNNTTKKLGIGPNASAPIGQIHSIIPEANGAYAAVLEKTTAATNAISSAAAICLTSTGNMADGFGPGLAFQIKDNAGAYNTAGVIGAVRGGTDNTGDLVFGPVLSAAYIERMRIKSNGNVGIGTDAPTAILHTVANGVLAGLFDRVVSTSNVATSVISVKLTTALAATDGFGPMISFQMLDSGGVNRLLGLIGNVKNGASNAADFIFSPAINGVTTEVMRITSDGRVGINTTAPIGELHVVSDSTTNADRGITSAQHSNSTSPAIIRFRKSRGTLTVPVIVATGDVIGTLAFNGYGTSYLDRARIAATVNGTVATNDVPTDLVFYTSVTTTVVERMRITSTGNVGIGTSSPNWKLTIVEDANSDNPLLTIRNQNAGFGATTRIQLFNNTGATVGTNGACIFLAGSNTSLPNNFAIWNYENGPIRIGTNNAERVRILSTGFVGIGTAAPIGELHVVSTTSSADRGITSAQYSSTNGAAMLKLRKSRGTEAAPTTVANDDNIGAISFNAYGTAYADRARIAAVARGTISANNVPTDLVFYTTDTDTVAERMRILSTGNIGIGTTSPFGVLHISAATNALIYATNTDGLSSTSGAGINLYNVGTPGAADQRLGFILFGANPTGTTYRNSAAITAIASGAWTDGTSQPTDLIFETTTALSATRTEKLRITAAGQLINTTDSDIILRRVANTTALYGLSIQGTPNFELGGIKANVTSGEIRIGAFRTTYFPTFYSHNLEVFRITTSGEIVIGASTGPSKLSLVATNLGAYTTTTTQNAAGFMLSTATAATSAAATQNGAPLILRSNAWSFDLTASHTVDFRFVNVATAPGSGSVFGTLRLQASINGATYSDPLTINSSGNLTVTGHTYTGGGSVFGFTSRSIISSPVNGNIMLRNNAGSDFNMLIFGGATSAFPALKRSATELQVRLADDSDFAILQAGQIFPRHNLWTNVQLITTDAVLDKTYNTIVVDASASDILIALPPASTSIGGSYSQSFTIIRTDAVTTNTVYVFPDGSDTILGNITGFITLTTTGETVTIKAVTTTEWVASSSGSGGGSGSISIGTTISGATSGSVLFVDSSALAENNAQFFWDNSTTRLGIGSATPQAKLYVQEDSLGNTTTAVGSHRSLMLQNSTPATSSVTQVSPGLALVGSAWNTTLSQTAKVMWRAILAPVSGATTESTLRFQFSNLSSTPIEYFTFTSAGNFGIGDSNTSPNAKISIWSNNLGAAQTPAGLTSSGLYMQNMTSSTAGVQSQVSPAITLEGTAWTTTSAVSQKAAWRVLLLPTASATTVGASLRFQFSINNGAFSEPFLFNANGQLNTGTLVASSSIAAGTNSNFLWVSKSLMSSPVNGNIRFSNQAGTDFGLLQFGGLTSAFPALKRSSTNLVVRLSDDSGNTHLEVADEAYGPTWSGSLTVPTKNALYTQFGNYVALSGDQTIAGNKTFTNEIIVTRGSGVVPDTNSLIYMGRNEPGNFYPLFVMEDKTDDGYAHFGVWGQNRKWNVGVGNGPSNFFGVPNRFFILDAVSNNVNFVIDPNRLIGISGITNPTAFLHIPANSATYAALRIEQSATDPSSPNVGDIWNNGGLLKFRVGSNNIVLNNATSGTYTPTTSGEVNIDSMTTYTCQYLKVDNVVTVSGKIDIDFTTASTQFSVELSLPVSSNFTANEEAGGTGASPTGTRGYSIYAKSSDTKVILSGVAESASNTSINFHFTYQIK